jgi:hypothetical protein
LVGQRHGWTCNPYPRLSRIDSISQNATSGVNTSAAPSLPVYFSMTGAAVASPTAPRRALHTLTD